VWSLSFSADGRRLASAGGGDHGEMKLWDLESGREVLGVALPVRVSGVALSPDARRLASAVGGAGYDPGEVKLWDVTTGRETLALRGHIGGVSSVAFSLDGWRLVSTGFDTSVRVWDATPLSGASEPSPAGRGP
jgi:WD40 repeat protein